MHTGVVLAVEARHGVARLVVGGELFTLRGMTTRLFFSGPAMTFMEASSMSSIVMALRLRRAASRAALVDEVLEVSARKACGALCDDP